MIILLCGVDEDAYTYYYYESIVPVKMPITAFLGACFFSSQSRRANKKGARSIFVVENGGHFIFSVATTYALLLLEDCTSNEEADEMRGAFF